VASGESGDDGGGRDDEQRIQSEAEARNDDEDTNER
jgi:hypothetical protein